LLEFAEGDHQELVVVRPVEGPPQTESERTREFGLPLVKCLEAHDRSTVQQIFENVDVLLDPRPAGGARCPGLQFGRPPLDPGRKRLKKPVDCAFHEIVIRGFSVNRFAP
jgi:hypothetical protein